MSRPAPDVVPKRRELGRAAAWVLAAVLAGAVVGVVVGAADQPVGAEVGLALARTARLAGAGVAVGALVVAWLVLPRMPSEAVAGPAPDGRARAGEPGSTTSPRERASVAVARVGGTGAVVALAGAGAGAALALLGGPAAQAAVPDRAHLHAEAWAGGLVLAGAATAAGSLRAGGASSRAWAVSVVAVLVLGAPVARVLTGAVGPLVAALDVVHVVAMGAWVGGLVVLVLVGRPLLAALGPGAARTRALAGGLRAFAPVALVAVAALTAAGTVLAVLRLEDLRELTTTGYGRAVLLKATLLVALVGIAAWQRERLAPELDELAGRGDHDPAPASHARAVRVLGRAVRAELVLMGGALLVAGVLGGLAAPAG